MFYTNSDDGIVFNAKNFEVCTLYVWHFGGKKRDLLNYVIMRDDTTSSIKKEDKRDGEY